MDPVPLKRLLGDDIRFIGLDLYLDLTFVCRFLCAGAGNHHGRNTTGKLGIKHRGGDSYTLLSA